MKKYKCERNGTVINIKTGRVLKPRIKDNGYCTVYLSNGNLRINKYVHRLVAEAFIPNPNNLPQINHKNGNKLDNRVENLEWCTQKYNNQHALDNKLRIPVGCVGTDNGRVILNEAQVLEIRRKYIPKKYTIPRLSQEYGVSYGTIQAIILRKIWKHI